MSKRLTTSERKKAIEIEILMNFRCFRTVKSLCDKHDRCLEILRIDGAQFTDRALDSICQCSHLQSFMIEFCTNLTGTNFSHFQVRRFSKRKKTNFLFVVVVFFSKEIFKSSRIIVVEVEQHFIEMFSKCF